MHIFVWKEVGKHFLFAIVVGVAVGLASVFLCLCVGWAYDVFTAFPWLIWTLPVMGVLELLLYRAFKLPLNMTTETVIATMRKNQKVPYTLAPGILIATCMSIFSGGSVGKEAGALQIGASLGSLISKPFKLKHVFRKNIPRDKTEPLNNYAASVGMAACFSALFFAPLGSCMFVLELTHFKRPVVHHVYTVLVACFVAYFVASFIGIGDIIAKVDLPQLNWLIVGQCIVIGVAVALMGAVFDWAIKFAHHITQAVTKNYFIWVIIAGIVFAILVTVFGWDKFTGTGGTNLNEVLHGSFESYDYLIKALLTFICLGFWFKGGEIMPSFCIGGLLGASCSHLTGGDAVFGAAIGVLTFFSAFSRCPLAAFLMGCEIFGWAAAPFLAIAIFVAYMFGYPVGMYGDGFDKVIVRHVLKSRGKIQNTSSNDA